MKNIAFFLIVFSSLHAHAADPSPECAGAADFRALNECRVNLQKEKLKILNSLIEQAAKNLPEQNDQDSRKTRTQLALSQKTWQQYVDANCNLIGALKGGGNQWVSYFAFECILEETQKRIDFFRNPPQAG